MVMRSLHVAGTEMRSEICIPPYCLHDIDSIGGYYIFCTGTEMRSETCILPFSPATMLNFLPSSSAAGHSRSRTCLHMI